MRTLLLPITIVAIFLVGSSFAGAQALPPLVVVFESEPLFAYVDFKPLDIVTRYVRVTNNTNASQPVIMEAINKTGCLVGLDCLAEKLRVRVRLGPTLLYNKTLKEFYDEGQVVIDPALPSGTTRQFDIEVAFETGPDDNDYQTLETGFDLLVGFQGADTVSSGGGGGGGTGIPGLLIDDEAAAAATSTGGVLITWATSYGATSQVLYGLHSGGPYTLNLALANYGYPNATPEDGTKVTDHAVYISGLIPGETYRYRVVSHASPPTVGYEMTFTVPKTEPFVAAYADTAVGKNPSPLGQTQVIADAREGFVQPPFAPATSSPEYFASVEGISTDSPFVPSLEGKAVTRVSEGGGDARSSMYLGYLFAIIAGGALSVFLRLFVGKKS